MFCSPWQHNMLTINVTFEYVCIIIILPFDLRHHCDNVFLVGLCVCRFEQFISFADVSSSCIQCHLHANCSGSKLRNGVLYRLFAVAKSIKQLIASVVHCITNFDEAVECDGSMIGGGATSQSYMLPVLSHMGFGYRRY